MICSKCSVDKPISEYHKNSCSSIGIRRDCKVCRLQVVKKYSLNNKETKRLSDLEYKKRRPDIGKKSRKKYYESNKELWGVYNSNRRTSKLNRTPKWLSNKDKSMIKFYYSLSYRLSNCLGIDFHVDHIIPLQGIGVSGLHVPSNLQVIPAKLNLIKRNKWQ